MGKPEATCQTVLTLDDIEDLARWALEEHGLAAAGWMFRWDRATKRAGCCKYTKKAITLSRPIFTIEANRDEALDTILHEVAHALAGSSAGHGVRWKDVARAIGARPERCHELEIPPTAYVGTCTCGSIHRRTRKPRAYIYTCRGCTGTVTWTDRNDAATATQRADEHRDPAIAASTRSQA